MELRQLISILLRRWWLVVIPTVVAAAYAVYGYVTTPVAGGFSTSVRYTAAVPGDVVEPESFEDAALAPWTSSEYVSGALSDWVRTTSFSEEVSAELARTDIEIPAAALQPAIAANFDRSVMVLILSWGDAQQLEQIAQAATTVLQEQTDDYFPQIGTVGISVTALDTPVIAPVPPPISARLDPIIRAALGVIAGVGLAFLIEYLDPTVRERREVEALGLPVLSEIPRGK